MFKKIMPLTLIAILLFIGCTSAPLADETAANIETIPTAVEVADLPTITPEPTLVPEPTRSPTDEPEQDVDPTVELEAEVMVEAIPTETNEPTLAPEPTATLSPAEQVIQSFSGSSQTGGDVLILYGEVLDQAGNPIPNAVVEIWQTDSTGVYDHPRDPGTGTRDTTFQFFGSALANSDGWYAFRTILPGEYEPRPRHIHFKVKQNGATLLTSQFYFSEDIAQVADEGIFQTAGNSGDLLLLQLTQGENQLLSYGRIVLNTDSGGDLPLTPTQAEGPYYPVVPLDEYDNDLVVFP